MTTKPMLLTEPFSFTVDTATSIFKSTQTVKCFPSGNRVYVQVPFSEPLRLWVKGLAGCRWHGPIGGKPPTKPAPADVVAAMGTDRLWSVDNSHRNEFRFRVALGLNPYQWCRDVQPTECEFERPLYAHQIEAVQHLLSTRCGILAYEMRLGKTLVFIELMERIGGNWCMYCPKSAIPEMELQFVHWNAQVRPTLFTDGGLKKLAADTSSTPDGVIFDESHRLKTHGAARSKAALAIADRVRERGGAVICATGSPAPHDPGNWWMQCEIARPGWLEEKDYRTAVNKWGLWRKHIPGISFPALITWWDDTTKCATCGRGDCGVGRPSGHTYCPSTDEIGRLRERLRGLVLTKFQRDVFDVPARQHEYIVLPPSKDTLRRCALVKSRASTTVEALTLLRELSDGFLYADAYDQSETQQFHTPKDEALEGLLDKYADVGRIVIYAGFTASVDKITRICQGADWKTIRVDGRGWATNIPDPLATFQNPTGDRIAFVGHPGAGGMGLTLSASPAIVFYSNDFDGGSRIQAEARIFAPGKICTTYDLLHLPTDSRIIENLGEKKRLQALTLTEVLGDYL